MFILMDFYAINISSQLIYHLGNNSLHYTQRSTDKYVFTEAMHSLILIVLETSLW